jgi:DNA-binding FrmR family transcriptional regulator
MSHNPANIVEDRRALQIRLRRIIGQLKGVESMVAGDYECAEVLNQIVSARSALKSLAEKILVEHVEHCLGDAHTPEQRRRDIKEVTTMLKRYVA